MRTMLKSKIHRVTVTEANIDYGGRITLDPVLMEATDILAFEPVHVLDISNGARSETRAVVAQTEQRRRDQQRRGA